MKTVHSKTTPNVTKILFAIAFERLGVASRAEAASMAVSLGLI